MKKYLLLLITATQITGATVARVYSADKATGTIAVQPAHWVTPTAVSLSQDDPQAEGQELFASEQISVSSIYPNPASASASVKYKFLGKLREAKIVLCNVLGNIVGEYRLSKDGERLHIATRELASGVYFYTLSIDGKSMVTRKLIVRHPS